MSALALSSPPNDVAKRHGDRPVTPESSMSQGNDVGTSNPSAKRHESVVSDGPSGSRLSLSSKRTPTNSAPTSALKDGANTNDNKDHKASLGSDQTAADDSIAAIDPLSQHILMRTNVDSSAPRSKYPVRLDGAGPDTLQRLSSDFSAKKGPSFLSRLSLLNRKKEDDLDDVSEIGEPRLSGSDARVFSSAVGAGGYIPHHKEPPRYIKVRTHNTKRREFNRVFLAQQLRAGDEQRPTTTSPDESTGTATAGGAIWALEFSKDGKYLAAAGRDRVVRVWAVLSSPEERMHHEEEETASKTAEERLSAPVFRGRPFREYTGHTGDVLDLSWSKNNFLLSASMDKTVRLWHMSRDECLCTFTHKDFVTSIAFHPTDDRFFLAGSLDAQLRLWSIPDKSTAYAAQVPDLVTAVAFSPDGKTAIAGVLNGTCLFFETEGLKLLTQMLVRSSRGKNAKGSKITGIKTMVIPPGGPNGEVKVLITSNDSRVRIYSIKDKSVDLKLKGHENVSSQIHASFGDDGKHVICGSEDKKVFIWSVGRNDPETREKVPYEYFDAHSARVSAAVFAPFTSRQLLSASGDPLYDLCNPPPVKLMSLEESYAASQTGVSDDTQPAPHTKTAPKESPVYVEKSKHPNGNIIVTADQTGSIKIFRQDCAHAKRRRHENLETGSNFSRKFMGQGSLLGRSGSVRTRTTAGSQPHSRRTSLSQAGMTSDRINTWRQGIDSGRNSTRNSLLGAASVYSERSTSPSRTPVNKAAVTPESRRQPQPTSRSASRSRPGSPGTSQSHPKDQPSPQPPTPSFSFRPADEDDQLRLDPAGASYSFWNLNRWRGPSSSLRNSISGDQELLTPHATSKAPAGQPRKSRDGRKRHDPVPLSYQPVDRPSDEENCDENRDENRDRSISGRRGDGNEGGVRRPSAGLYTVASRLSSEEASDDDQVRTCEKCGSHGFKTKKMAGKRRLLCSKCGKIAEDATD